MSDERLRLEMAMMTLGKRMEDAGEQWVPFADQESMEFLELQVNLKLEDFLQEVRHLPPGQMVHTLALSFFMSGFMLGREYGDE